MNMKSWIFKLIVAIMAFAIPTECNAINLMPGHFVLQSGGAMGIVSAGTGWSYGPKNRWETDIFVGFIPKYDSNSAKAIISLKENFRPWNLRINDKFHFAPLTTSLYFTSIPNNRFWIRQPDRYPSGYYILPTKFRINLSVGQRIEMLLPKDRTKAKSLTAFYELSTCDLYVLSAFSNKYLKPDDWLQLCIGLRLNI